MDPDFHQRVIEQCILSVAIFLTYIQFCFGHGRMIEPPSRPTAWRYGFSTPPDYNDHELYCGGFVRQWQKNAGKCGECGDPFDMTIPRPHEHGGLWGQGVIVRRYSPGEVITIRIELTASHMGYFEFRLCPDPNAKQDCLDKYLLEVLKGSPSLNSSNDLKTRFYPRHGSRIYEIKAQLPLMKCDQCVLQWRYVAGNNWGICSDGNGAVGCGPQEEFRSCADIALGGSAQSPRPQPTSPKKTNVHSKTAIDEEITKIQDTQSTEDDASRWMWALVLFMLFNLLCILPLWHMRKWLYSIIQQWIALNDGTSNMVGSLSSNIDSKANFNSITTIWKPKQKLEDTVLELPPVPPPRMKHALKLQNIKIDGENSEA